MALRIARHRLQPELQIEIRTDSHTNQVVEEYQYYVDSESGERVRHGYCRAFYPDDSPMESSQYDHGKTEGEWEYENRIVPFVGDPVFSCI